MRVLFTYRTYNVFSAAVRVLTGQRYSHVAVELADGRIYESVGTGCRAVSRQEFFQKNEIVEVVVLPEPAFAANRARAFLGRAYDIPAILWFLFVCLVERLTSKRLPRLTLNPRWLICSEYAWYILYAELATVTPADLYERIASGQEPYGRR